MRSRRNRGDSSATLWYDLGMATLDSDSLQRFLKQFTETITPELANHFANLPLNREFQQLLDELGQKANDATLTEDERREYETYVEVMDVLALLRVNVTRKSGNLDH
jgi:biopolymer transport protein ExbD